MHIDIFLSNTFPQISPEQPPILQSKFELQYEEVDILQNSFSKTISSLL